MTVSKALWLAAVIYGGVAYSQTANSASISLDPSRPYVQIVFDHFGKRTPVFEDEPSVGVWLRLYNNCVLPIKVNVISGENRNSGLLVAHEVIEGRSSILTVRGQPVQRLKKPIGYEIADVVNSREIEPGSDLLFSIPLTHVTRRWSIRVEVTLVHATVANARQPRTFVDFDWSGLSAKAREAADREFLGMKDP
jgi:hypothetical protein